MYTRVSYLTNVCGQRSRTFGLAALYFLFIIAADVVAARWLVPVLPWWGIVAPAGVLFVGPVLTIRDRLHDLLGTRDIIFLILEASLVSWMVGGLTNQGLLQSVSLASAVAFVASELVADTGVYAALAGRPWIVRVLLSNLVSAPVDSVLFIGLAFGTFIDLPFWTGWQLMVGQSVAKVVVGALWAAGWLVVNRLFPPRPWYRIIE